MRIFPYPPDVVLVVSGYTADPVTRYAAYISCDVSHVRTIMFARMTKTSTSTCAWANMLINIVFYFVLCTSKVDCKITNRLPGKSGPL